MFYSHRPRRLENARRWVAQFVQPCARKRKTLSGLDQKLVKLLSIPPTSGHRSTSLAEEEPKANQLRLPTIGKVVMGGSLPLASLTHSLLLARQLHLSCQAQLSSLSTTYRTLCVGAVASIHENKDGTEWSWRTLAGVSDRERKSQNARVLSARHAIGRIRISWRTSTARPWANGDDWISRAGDKWHGTGAGKDN